MSKELLIGLQKECVELSVAGSDFAIGNFKLQKLLPKFEKLGQKIKPFKMVADRMNNLLNSDKEKSDEHLIALLSLVNAIVLTQAQTDIEGEIEIVEGTSMNINTNMSYHLISPVANALTTSGGGRLNVIEEGFQTGVFSDFRLMPLLIKGLDDNYNEIGQLIYEKLLEMNNSELLTLLEESFDRQGKRGDAFRVSLIGKILGDDAREFCINLLEDSSKEVKAEAINVLGNMDGSKAILLEQLKSKTKDIRRAAYLGLVKINSEDVIEELKKAIKKTDYDIVLEAINTSKSENYADVLLTGLKDIYGKLVKKESAKGIEKISDILNVIINHKSEDVFDFLVNCLEEGQMDNWKAYYHTEVERKVVECIGEYEDIPEEVRDLIESRKSKNNNRIFDLALKVALENRNPKEVYEIYSPYFIKKRLSKNMIDDTIYVFCEYLGCSAINMRGYRYSWYRDLSDIDINNVLKNSDKQIDERWKEIFREYKIYSILAYTLDKEDTNTVKFLLSKLKESKKQYKKYDSSRKHEEDCICCIIGLLKIGYKKVYEIIFDKIKASTDYNFIAEDILLFIPYLPVKYMKAVEKYAMDLKKKNEKEDNPYLTRRVKYILEILESKDKNTKA